MNCPPMTDELANRIEGSELQDYAARLVAFESEPGNPYGVHIHGVHIRRFGDSTGLT